MRKVPDYIVYQSATKSIIYFCMLLALCNIGLMLYLFDLYFNKAQKTYYATTYEGELIPLVAKSKQQVTALHLSAKTNTSNTQRSQKDSKLNN